MGCVSERPSLTTSSRTAEIYSCSFMVRCRACATVVMDAKPWQKTLTFLAVRKGKSADVLGAGVQADVPRRARRTDGKILAGRGAGRCFAPPPRVEKSVMRPGIPRTPLSARFFPHTEIIPPPPPSGLGNMGAYSWAGRIIHTQGEIFPGKNRADSLALCAPVRSQDTDAYHGRGLRTQNAYR